jgi:hypothetical protein
MKKSDYMALLSLAVSVVILAAGCARGVEVQFGSTPPERESRPPGSQRTPQENYRIAYTLWDVDLSELLSRTTGGRRRVELAFDRLRADLALMRDLLGGEDREMASSLLARLDELRLGIIRARNRTVIDRRLAPIAKEVRRKLSPSKVRLAQPPG